MSVTLLTNCQVAQMTAERPYGLIPRGAVALKDALIDWVGSEDELPTRYSAAKTHDLGGRLVTPTLIDCHTHLVHGGDRAREFEMRLEGADYQEIAKAGGGIVSTMTATRSADFDDLLAQSLPRLDALIAEGVAVVEVKSGYGLTIPDEIKILRVARKLAELRPVQIKTSWLAAHDIAPEYQGRSDAYIDEVAIAGLREAKALGLVDAVDGFCEGIAFSPAQIARLFDVAGELGLPVKLHAEQLSNLGGAALAASYKAISADHLEHLDQAGIEAMARTQTVAVLLPGAFFTLRETQIPPVDALQKAQVPIAIATDANPGSSPLYSPLLTMNMAATLFGLTPQEALEGMTRHAASALGLAGETGTIEASKRADLAIWNVKHPAELAYRMGFNPLFKTIIGGRI
ncbi:MAG: imidazolonepropionase [Alphaproteobacteria bacterium]|nr:imidazolonepropionase [Alphaproteobacteria bacterium]